MQRGIRNYDEQLYNNKLSNLVEMENSRSIKPTKTESWRNRKSEQNNYV